MAKSMKAMKVVQQKVKKVKADAKAVKAMKVDTAVKAMKVDKAVKGQGKLSAKKLAALGALGGNSTMGLDEKIAQLRNSVEANGGALVPEASALSKLDRSKIWQQGMTAMKHNEKLKEDYEEASKQGKVAQSRVLLAWKMDPSQGHLYSEMTQTISNAKSVSKTERWMSQMELNLKWSAEEIEAHTFSGKISWRECPQTPGATNC